MPQQHHTNIPQQNEGFIRRTSKPFVTVNEEQYYSEPVNQQVHNRGNHYFSSAALLNCLSLQRREL